MKRSSSRANKTPHTAPRLGLVCLTTDDQVRYRAITRTRFLRMSPKQQRATLDELYRDNLARLLGALRYCHANNIALYRATSNLFPLCDEQAGEEALNDLAAELARVGALAKKLSVRVIAHPDQFVVLSSITPRVVETSIHIMSRHARVFDLLKLPRSPWSCLILHGGKSGRADELIRVIKKLPANIKRRLVLENDERAYSAQEILQICKAARVPMVFDAHHHVIKEGLDDFEHPSIARFVRAARATWPDPAWQIVHLSNGRENFRDPRHSDLITTWPSSYARAPWIEVEAKGKQEAIAHLRSIWPQAR